MSWREAVLVQPISRLHQVGGLLRLCLSWAASGGRAVGWGTLGRCPRRLGLTWRTLFFLHAGGGAVVAYLLNNWILGPVAPLTGLYSRGGLN